METVYVLDKTQTVYIVSIARSWECIEHCLKSVKPFLVYHLAQVSPVIFINPIII
jgi:hypothetical protein